MRRARLKVQATVPIRRKLQEQAKTDDAEKSPGSNNLPSDSDKQTLDRSMKRGKLKVYLQKCRHKYSCVTSTYKAFFYFIRHT